MKHPDQLAESIARFQRGFWARETIDRPPVGVAPDRSWLPVQYLKGILLEDRVEPENLSPALLRTDYEDASFNRRVFIDDWIPYNAAWRAVPWLEAISGCAVRLASGSLSATPFVEGPDDLADLVLPSNGGWLESLKNCTKYLIETSPNDCFVSPTILRGPSDVLAGLLGLSEFFLALYDDPETMATAIHRAGSLLLDVADAHFGAVDPRLGGYGHIYGYWAPGPTIVIQEDVMGLASPDLFYELVLEEDTRLVDHLGDHTLFHLHSTGYEHWRQLLGISGLAGIELTVESNGPSLLSLRPMLREILEHTRLILFVDAYFEELPEAVRELSRDGLYVLVSDKFIRDDDAFRELLSRTWPQHH